MRKWLLSFLRNILPLKKYMYAHLIVNNITGLSYQALFNYIKYRLNSKKPGPIMKGYGPVMSSIYVTRRCNLSCSFCIMPKLPEKCKVSDLDADVDKIRKIMEHPLIKKCLHIVITGGEPLLVPEIGGIVRLVKQHGHFVSIITNGTLLMRRIEELKQNRADIISVSLYENNMQQLADILPRANAVFPCRANKLIRRSDLEKYPERIEEAIRLAKDTGCFGIYMANYLPQGGESSDEVIYDDNIYYDNFKEEIGKKYDNYPIYWASPLKRNIGEKDKLCRMPWYYLLTDIKGNMGLCCNYPIDHSGEEYGNLFAEPLEDTLNHPSKTAIRRILLANSSFVPEKCSQCYILSDQWGSNL
ncbi:MAG: hypothetical protein JL50_11400 [Peptococcaceae bacterium BICA1-7]|nr:MAG: hypothetical protein JL50_11400 [Peptococcaceae bacterium BICA1-7]